MNIGNNIEHLNQISPSQSTEPTAVKVGATAAPSQSASSSLTSALANDHAQLSAAGTQASQASSISDVRLDKVASIQSALKAGTYQVPASEVAQKIVDSLLTGDR